ncbi:hypothetical protein Dda_0716 [Drechslerella dactyloides]|uniref:A-kinase anchor protein 7-like phosphoesterase domain-containing protein n=1 Tax=Drechslerella dactyloides TaxID=74499 RepID=A0AAD6J528_DREDA|nr:hypothetical protein Dda_0716 [Drechslerella dactyloides]
MSDASDPETGTVDVDFDASAPQPTASSSAHAGRAPRERLTHFLAIPLHGQFLEPLPAPHSAFKAAIKQFTIDEAPSEHDHDYDSEPSTRIPDGAIREFNTLHLTLGVMLLRDGDAVTKAVSALESLDLKQFLPSTSTTTGDAVTDADAKAPLFIDLRGLSPMATGAIKKCSVLMMPPTDATNRLYPFANALKAHFTTLGLLQEEHRPLKLHATLVNTIYCKPDKTARDSRRKEKDKNARGGKKGKGRRIDFRFDASEVLQRYDGHVFGQGIEVDRVQICKMGAKKGVEVVGEDGEVDVVGGGYEVVASKTIW